MNWKKFFERKKKHDILGVVYSDDFELDEIKKNIEKKWVGGLHNVNLYTAPPLLYNSVNQINKLQPGPEKSPYTFWERIGLVPVHSSRIRPRQYYHPVTDFGLYSYDEVSPEEKELTAKWMAKVMEFNGAIPAGILCAAGCFVLPLHTVYRMPLLVAAGITGVAVEVTRGYIGASEQRQDLDDFILAKEIWYIKNMETYQLGLPRLSFGDEKSYQELQSSYTQKA